MNQGIIPRIVKDNPAKQLVYLGVTLSKNMAFTAHIQALALKTKPKLDALRRLLPNVSGPSSSKRRIMAAVAENVILYAAPVWAHAMEVGRCRSKVTSLQRTALLRVTSAYRTVSAEALQVIAGATPIHLAAMERKRLFNMGESTSALKKAARHETLMEWQRSWSAMTSKAQWTKRLIPDIVLWVNCPHRRVSYYFTQFLTGHGSFGTFTARIGKTESDLCWRCDAPDSPEHLLYHCTRWQTERELLERELRTIPPIQDLTRLLCGYKRVFASVYDFVTAAVRKKEIEDLT